MQCVSINKTNTMTPEYKNISAAGLHLHKCAIQQYLGWNVCKLDVLQ